MDFESWSFNFKPICCCFFHFYVCCNNSWKVFPLFSQYYNKILSIYNVFKHDSSKMCEALGKLTTILYLDATIVIAQFLSKSHLAENHSRLLIYFIGFNFAKLVVKKLFKNLLINLGTSPNESRCSRELPTIEKINNIFMHSSQFLHYP